MKRLNSSRTLDGLHAQGICRDELLYYTIHAFQLEILEEISSICYTEDRYDVPISLLCRAVSKYLQTLFLQQGSKSLSLENLLVGKSRKEASRMFFETLVFSTYLIPLLNLMWQ